jgi:hypothetical protein
LKQIESLSRILPSTLACILVLQIISTPFELPFFFSFFLFLGASEPIDFPSI